MSDQKGMAFYNEGEDIKNPKGEARMTLVSIWPDPDRENQWLAKVVVPTGPPDHFLILEDTADIVGCLRYYAELSISDKIWIFVVHWEGCSVLDSLKKARSTFSGLSAAIEALSIPSVEVV